MNPKTGFFQARGLKAGFHATEVLHGLSFRFPLGPTTALVGPGGSGKSTLLRILANRHVTNSEYWQTGKISFPPATSSFLQQKFNSGLETLQGSIQSTNPGIVNPEKYIEQLWDTNVEAVYTLNLLLNTSLRDVPRHFVRIAELTALFASDADCLFIDEPESGLDSPYLEWVVPFLNRHRRTRPLVFVTHHLDVARSASDHCIFMVDGKIVEQNETAALFDSPKHKRTQYFVTMGG